MCELDVIGGLCILRCETARGDEYYEIKQSHMSVHYVLCSSGKIIRKGQLAEGWSVLSKSVAR